MVRRSCSRIVSFGKALAPPSAPRCMRSNYIKLKTPLIFIFQILIPQIFENIISNLEINSNDVSAHITNLPFLVSCSFGQETRLKFSNVQGIELLNVKIFLGISNILCKNFCRFCWKLARFQLPVCGILCSWFLANKLVPQYVISWEIRCAFFIEFPKHRWEWAFLLLYFLECSFDILPSIVVS
jgi:hypothetical protein